jgi:hypothetical protein
LLDRCIEGIEIRMQDGSSCVHPDSMRFGGERFNPKHRGRGSNWALVQG